MPLPQWSQGWAGAYGLQQGAARDESRAQEPRKVKVVPLSIRVCSAQVSQNLYVLCSLEISKPLWLKVLPDPP